MRECGNQPTAAPATVSGEPLPDATDLSQATGREGGKVHGPASQETCRPLDFVPGGVPRRRSSCSTARSAPQSSATQELCG
jgi:hypothetical protein